MTAGMFTVTRICGVLESSIQRVTFGLSLEGSMVGGAFQTEDTAEVMGSGELGRLTQEWCGGSQEW